MKKLLYTLAAVLVCTGAAAQNPTLYFMEGVPLRSQMNPALAPQRGYFNIPVLGGLAVTAGGNTSLDHLLFRRDGRLVTLLSPSVSSADALSDLHSKNLVNADIRVNGTERIVCALCSCFGQGIEKCTFSDVRKAHDT